MGSSESKFGEVALWHAAGVLENGGHHRSYWSYDTLLGFLALRSIHSSTAMTVSSTAMTVTSAMVQNRPPQTPMVVRAWNPPPQMAKGMAWRHKWSGTIVIALGDIYQRPDGRWQFYAHGFDPVELCWKYSWYNVDTHVPYAQWTGPPRPGWQSWVLCLFSSGYQRDVRTQSEAWIAEPSKTQCYACYIIYSISYILP